MKKDTHPSYHKVLFVDSASGHRFICGSTLQPEGREIFEGIEYPVCYLSISSTSHPLFTGSSKLVDSEGRVQKFKKRFERKKEVAAEPAVIQSSTPAAASDKAAPTTGEVSDKKATAKKTTKKTKKG
jgi:large subunit ribosomal protein L31